MIKTKKELIQYLLTILDEIPYRDISGLNLFKTKAGYLIKILSGDTSDHRYQLKQTRFAPWGFDAKEEEYQRSWQGGKEIIIDILKSIETNSEFTFPVLPAPLDPSQIPIESVNPESTESSQIDDQEFSASDNSVTADMIAQRHKEEEKDLALPQEEPPSDQPDVLNNIETPVEFPLNTDVQPGEVGSEKVQSQNSLIQTILVKVMRGLKLIWERIKISHRKSFDAGADSSREPVKQSDPIPEEPKPLSQAQSQGNNPLEESNSPISETNTPKTEVLSDSTAVVQDNTTISNLSNRILLISGRDSEMKQKVTSVLGEFGLITVLSFAEENFNKSLAQKTTEVSDISFVVVLLSFDGYFYLKDQKSKDARLVSLPNIIFELGYMIGKFGRNKVFVLYTEKKNFEFPSGFFDAYYIPYDLHRLWQKELMKALVDHGYKMKGSPVKQNH